MDRLQIAGGIFVTLLSIFLLIKFFSFMTLIFFGIVVAAVAYPMISQPMYLNKWKNARSLGKNKKWYW